MKKKKSIPYVDDQEEEASLSLLQHTVELVVYIVVDISIGQIYSEPITLKWLCN